MKENILLGCRLLIQFIVLVVCGIIFVNVMNMIDMFYLSSHSNYIVYALLYIAGVLSIQISLLWHKLKGKKTETELEQ